MEDDEGITGTITPILMVFIGMVIVSGLMIPFLLELTEDPLAVEGNTYSYSPDTNLDAVYSYGGTLLDHSQYTLNSDGSITIELTEKGTYTFEVYATSYHPYQTAVQTFDVEVGEYSPYHDYKPLLMVIPVLLFVGLILYALGRRVGSEGGEGGDGFGGMSFGGGGGRDISGGFGRSGSR